MYWDRFDIREAYYLYFVDYQESMYSEKYKRLCKLTRPGFFKPRSKLDYDNLTDNGKKIYDNLELNYQDRGRV